MRFPLLLAVVAGAGVGAAVVDGKPVTPDVVLAAAAGAALADEDVVLGGVGERCVASLAVVDVSCSVGLAAAVRRGILGTTTDGTGDSLTGDSGTLSLSGTAPPALRWLAKSTFLV